MKVASSCPVCASYIDASCILYNGEYLPNLDISPGDPLDEILVKIDAAIGSTTTTTTTTPE